IESGAPPDFQRPVADAVELVANRQHVLGAHAGRQQRLVGIAQDGVGNGDLLAHDVPYRPAWAAMAVAMAMARCDGLRLIEYWVSSGWLSTKLVLNWPLRNSGLRRISW